MELRWNESGLLSEQTETARSKKSLSDARNAFDSDYDRIVFSSPFRRLQDKAQVFPLEKSDFVRTRLTHSIEVSAIAKSIGVSVEKKLIELNYMDQNQCGKIPTILASAGLAHDLGNPPFGHFGEETIKKVFKQEFNNRSSIDLPDKLKADLLNFDGNCQTIRLLTRLQCLDDKYAYHLTYATLATLMKYPMSSIKGNKKKDKIKGIAYKKFGYFYSEKDSSEEVLNAVGTHVEEGEAVRHPLAFLLEAADDIAYSAADLEDGFKKKVVTFENIKEVFSGQEDIIAKLEDYEKNNNYGGNEKAIQQFRIYIQGEMISAVTDTFIEKQDELLSGTYKEEILLDSRASNIRKSLKKLADIYILNNKEIQKTELAGESIISFLLKFLLEALATEEVVEKIIKKEADMKEVLDSRQQRVYNLISVDYRNVYEKEIRYIIKNFENKSEMEIYILYYTYILITDFISCMTDNYSLELYRRLKGISIN